MLVVVLAVGIAIVRVDGGDDRVSAPDPTATTTTTTAQPSGVAEALIGKWLPLSIAGYDGPLSSPPLSVPLLRFDRRGNWKASDGCNTVGGWYRTTGRSFSTAELYTTALDCALDGVPTGAALSQANRFEVHDGQLTFFANDGTELARYVRAVVTARIELPSRTIVAGSTMSGRVRREQHWKALEATGCGSLFQVALVNDAVQPSVPWNDCAQQFTIPVGESSYQVVVRGTYLVCSDCPTGGPPPLPLGEYKATLFQRHPVVPTPPPIAVTIVAP